MGRQLFFSIGQIEGCEGSEGTGLKPSHGAIRHNTDPVVRGILACSRRREDKGRKKFGGGERRFLGSNPYPAPTLFFFFNHFAPCQRSERLQQASGILTWQKDQVKYL